MVIAGTTNKPRKAQGFRAGLNQVRVGDYGAVCKELMAALSINNRTSFAHYASGRQEMKITQAEAVEGVFIKYGITRNIWGL